MSNVTPQNCHACFAFSTFVVLYAWASSDGIEYLFFNDASSTTGSGSDVQWVQLLRGVHDLLKCYFFWLEDGPLKGLLNLGNDNAKSMAEASSEDSSRFAALEELWEKAPTPFATSEVDSLQETLNRLKETYALLFSLDGADAVSAVLSWPVLVPEAYIQLLKKRQPEALVLLAHYCLLLNRIDDFWWMRGMSRHLLQTIHRTIGKEWESWINWPLQDLVLSEFRNQVEKDEIKYGLPSRSIDL